MHKIEVGVFGELIISNIQHNVTLLYYNKMAYLLLFIIDLQSPIAG